MEDPGAGTWPAGDRLVDEGLLWTGGVATAMVATLVTLIGVIIARGILGVPMVVPTAAGTWGDISAASYLGTAACTLIATGLLQGLLLLAPEPLLFFGWTMTLATAATGLMPFAAHAALPSEVVSGAVNMAVCWTVWSLLAATGRASLIPRAPWADDGERTGRRW
jgi:Family of unknown function (DUF6069)